MSTSSTTLAAGNASFVWPFRILSWILGLVDNVVILLRFVSGPRAPKFFKNGWNWDSMDKAFTAQRKLIEELSQPGGDYSSVRISAKDIEWSEPQEKSGVVLRSASFPSPVAHLLPPESKDCHFLLVTPKSSTPSTYLVMLPATGEMGKRERLSMAREFARTKGYASIIVTAPFYARRAPSGQQRFFLGNVADALVQSQAIIQEATSLIRHVMRSSNADNDDDTIIPASPSNKVVVTGFSWGSSMSSMSCATSLLAGVDGKRLACVAYVGCSSPEVFADGVLENGVDWDALLKDKADTTSFQGVDIASLETPQQAQEAMLRILSQVQLSSTVDAILKKDPSNQLAAVKMQTMYDDGFIRRNYSSAYAEQMKLMTKTSNFQLRWMPGGHVLGAMLRPVLQKKAILDAVSKMEKDS